MRVKKFRNKKCLDELFTLEEFKLANSIRGTYECGYSPIALNDETQILGWCSFGTRLSRHMTLRFYYATKVWQEALFILSKESDSNYCFGKPVWMGDGSGFRFIQFKQGDKHPLDSKISRFWEILREVADSKKISVSEQIIRKNETLKDECYKHKEQIRIEYILDKNDLSQWRGRRFDLFQYNFSSEKRTYSWDEIKDLFVEISPKILSLVHCENMNDYNPNDTATQDLHEACKKLDIGTAKKALQDGADPNGFDRAGATPLVICVENCMRHRPSNGGCDISRERKKQDIDTCISVMELLLENGADIDFFGADNNNALTETYFPEIPELMQFLLENGANPNHNCAIIDEPWTWYYQSGVLHLVLDRIAFEELDYEKANDDLLAMENLLIKYGAKLYIDGFNPDEYFQKD